MGLSRSGSSSSLLKSVRASSTSNGTFATAFEAGDTIDGVVLATGDRILIPFQSSSPQRGIYVVSATGAPTRAGDFSRTDDIRGAIVHVREGTLYADALFLSTQSAAIVLETTDITFERMYASARNFITTTQSQYNSPNGLSGVDIEDTRLEFYRDHGAPEDFATDGMRWQVGQDFVELRAGAKDATTFQLFPLTSFDVELADLAGGADKWWHRDGSSVIRDLASMESRKGSAATATIPSASTEVIVTHGAGYTPVAQDIMVTPTNSPTNDPGHWWVDTITSTTFKIKVRTDPGASGATFAWRVDR